MVTSYSCLFTIFTQKSYSCIFIIVIVAVIANIEYDNIKKNRVKVAVSNIFHQFSKAKLLFSFVQKEIVEANKAMKSKPTS